MEQTDQEKLEEKFIDKLSTIEDLIDEDKFDEVSNDELDFIANFFLKNKMNLYFEIAIELQLKLLFHKEKYNDCFMINYFKNKKNTEWLLKVLPKIKEDQLKVLMELIYNLKDQNTLKKIIYEYLIPTKKKLDEQIIEYLLKINILNPPKVRKLSETMIYNYSTLGYLINPKNLFILNTLVNLLTSIPQLGIPSFLVNKPEFNTMMGIFCQKKRKPISLTKRFYERGDYLADLFLNTMIDPILLDKESIDVERKRVEENIDDILTRLDTIQEHYLLEINKTLYYLSFHGRKNRSILAKVNKIYRHLYPKINYTNPNLNKLPKQKDEKINIGFISKYFFNHSVGKDRSNVIINLPRDKFNVSIFFFPPIKDDYIAHKLKQSKSKNVILPNKFEDKIKEIENQKLDILVYCDIGMNSETYMLACCRLAPIQMNTWGHSETSGIDTLDYFMSSRYYETETAQDNYTEKLIRLDSLCTQYENPYKKLCDFANYKEYKHKIPIEYKPKTKKFTIFFIPQQIQKIHSEMFDIIKKLLMKNKRYRILLIKNPIGYLPDFMEMLNKKVGEELVKNQIVFIDKMVKYLKFLHQMESTKIILDTYPFGGCNTSFEAFSLGKPVVTWPSKFLNGRFTQGFYKKMGFTDLVVSSVDEYVETAHKLAQDKKYYKKMQKKIHENSDKLFMEQKSVDDWSEFCQSVVYGSDKDKQKVNSD